MAPNQEVYLAWSQWQVYSVDAYIACSRQNGRAISTINRRLAALRTFYRFLNIRPCGCALDQSGHPPATPPQS